MKRAMILALQSSNAKKVPPLSTIRAAVISEIAGSIFLVLLLQLGGGFAVATYFAVTANL